MQRRLFALGDESVRSTWRKYVVDEDRDALEEALLYIVHGTDEDEDDAGSDGSSTKDDSDEGVEGAAAGGASAGGAQDDTDDDLKTRVIFHLLSELEENDLLSKEDADTAREMAACGAQVCLPPSHPHPLMR
jgi:hypothetical protein